LVWGRRGIGKDVRAYWHLQREVLQKENPRMQVEEFESKIKTPGGEKDWEKRGN